MRHLPDGNETESPSLRQQLLSRARPYWRRYGAILKPFLLLVVAFVLFDVTLRVAARPSEPQRRSAASTFFTKALAGGLQRMHSSVSDNVNPVTPYVAGADDNSPIQLPGVAKPFDPSAQRTAPPRPAVPTGPSGNEEGVAASESQPAVRGAPDDLITALVRSGKTYSDLPEYATPATLAPEERARLLQDATTMTSEGAGFDEPDSTVSIQILPHEVAPLRIAVTNTLVSGFESFDGPQRMTRMVDAKPAAPKLTGSVEPSTHGFREFQAQQGERDGTRYRTVAEPITDDQVQRYRDQLRDVWTKVSARLDPQTASPVTMEPGPALLDWHHLANNALQQFTASNTLTVGNVMDIRAAKKFFDFRRAQSHQERRQNTELIELICLAGKAGDLPCHLLPREWNPEFDAGRPRESEYPQNKAAFTIAVDDWNREHPCGSQSPLPPALRRLQEEQAKETDDRLFQNEWTVRLKVTPVHGNGPESPEALLKSQMEGIVAAATAGDESLVASQIRNFLPRGLSLRHGLSVYTYPDNRARLEAWTANLSARPDSYWSQLLAVRPGQTEVRVVKLNETEKDLVKAVPSPELAEVLQFDQTYYNVVFAAPGAPDGPTLGFFYWTGARWQMLGEFWHAFENPKPARK